MILIIIIASPIADLKGYYMQNTTRLNLRTHKISASHYPLWSNISTHFSETLDCFTAYLAMEAAEVVEGAKPGNLVNLVNRQRPCGLNPYQLWKQFGPDLLADTGLRAFELADRNDSLLLYLYRPDLLESLLKRRGVAIILQRQGYLNQEDLAAILGQLQLHIASGPFPHEIGIFLGYPLKDVLAFMGTIQLPFACQGPWKIYGDPAPSLELACRYRDCRWRMARRLRTTSTPASCLLARPATA